MLGEVFLFVSLTTLAIFILWEGRQRQRNVSTRVRQLNA